MQPASIPPFPHERTFSTYLEQKAGTPVQPTGITAAVYLDIAERIVREAAKWQDAAGRIIDPELGKVHAQTSPRYASSLAPLLKAGRCADLLESCVRCIDVSVRDLASGNGSAFDFWARDIVLAIQCVQDRVPAERTAEWKRLLASYDPQVRYSQVTSKCKPQDIHNFCIYAVAGEQMKRQFGAGDNLAFIDEHLAIQRDRFTPLGMYRDPNCPTTYDLTVRQCLGLLLSHGYDGAHRSFADEMTRRGALMQLFFQSTAGEVPFGGRSNQFHHVEGMFCWNAEYEASRCKALGNLRLAGVFKRAAHRAAAATLRWTLQTTPPTHIKNRFPRQTLHGCDPYGYVTGYILLASNLFASAALIADDTIEECAAPCDAGGYVLPILDDFHRIFASCGPLHVQVDTRGQAGFDATGLCRVHHRDRPTELGLSLGIVRSPHYRTAEPAFDRNVAIGPAWQGANGAWESLADAQPTTPHLEILREAPNEVAFRVHYRLEAREVTEQYVLTPDAVTVSAASRSGLLRLSVPLILTDGDAVSQVRQDGKAWEVSYRGNRFRAEALDADTALGRLNVRAPNRNGVYDIATFDRQADTVSVRLSFP